MNGKSQTWDEKRRFCDSNPKLYTDRVQKGSIRIQNEQILEDRGKNVMIHVWLVFVTTIKGRVTGT